MTCALSHAIPAPGLLTEADLWIRIAGNGSHQVVAICPGCSTQIGPLSHERVRREAGREPASLPIVADYRGTLGRCSRRGCEREAVEDHHFAPRAIFGDEADDWPRALLCLEHHIEWHRRMAAA